jgi:hypothetical protein
MGSDDSAKGLPPERQRPAPTIDLKANEVSSRAIGEEPPPAAAEADQAKTDQAEAAQGAAPDSSGPAGTSDQAPPPSRPLSARPMLWAAAACAAIVLFAAGLWIGVSWMNRDDQLTQIAARLMRIEAVLANAPAADAAIKMTADNVASLNKRLDEIAGSVRDARSRADNAVAAAEASQKAGNAPGQARVDTEALSNRIAALEQSTRSNERELAADDKISRRALVASALRDAVERGQPFTAELAAAKVFVVNEATLTPLEAFAATGLPSVVALARELSTLAQPMMKLASEPARQGGVMEKIQASAERLVRIRPVGEAPGDDPTTVIARVEAKAARNDIGGAAADLAKLPVAARAPAEAWIKRAVARDAAIAASRQFAQDALGALGKPSL